MKQGSILSFLQKPPVKIQVAALPTASCEEEIDTNDSHDEKTSSAETVKLQLTLAAPVQQKRDVRISIGKICPSQIHALKIMTTTLLPVRYSDKFYNECLSDDPTILCAVATFDSKPVGWIRCRIEPFPNADNHVYDQIYIQALGVLAPYRNLGMAIDLLTYITKMSRSATFNVQSIYAHVWEKNGDGLEWYNKRGFKRIMLQPQYYRKLRPSGAWILRKELDEAVQ